MFAVMVQMQQSVMASCLIRFQTYGLTTSPYGYAFYVELLSVLLAAALAAVAPLNMFTVHISSLFVLDSKKLL